MILLSFDVEEFDVPDEFGYPLPFAEQIDLSREGTVRVLDALLAHQVKATFFITVNFARQAPEIVQRIVDEGHELGSHGVFHSRFDEADLLMSRQELEMMSGRPVKGYRMPRMMPVNEKAVAAAGYVYNSSLNPTWLPGRYNNLDQPRSLFYKEQVLQIPASVSPWVRFPLFWITFHVLPMWLYLWLCRWTLRKDRYLNLYFHPWEFVDLRSNPKFKLPSYVTKNTGNNLVGRLDDLIRHFKPKTRFGRTDEMLDFHSR